MKIHRKLTAIVYILLVFIASCTPVPEGSRDELVDVGTHSLYIHCTGTGKPTIVIDTGWERVMKVGNQQSSR